MKKTIAIALFAALGLSAAIADTHEDRETLMKANGGALKALGAAGAAMPFDPAAAKAPSQTLIDNAAKIPALFAPGTETADTGRPARHLDRRRRLQGRRRQDGHRCRRPAGRDRPGHLRRRAEDGAGRLRRLPRLRA